MADTAPSQPVMGQTETSNRGRSRYEVIEATLMRSQEGRAFLYSPCVAEYDASRSEVRHVLHRFFDNSRERLMLSLLGESDITQEELQRLKEAIAQAEAAAESEGM